MGHMVGDIGDPQTMAFNTIVTSTLLVLLQKELDYSGL